jgi:LysR family transcriptional regulator, cys regulon transcriptional activator
MNFQQLRIIRETARRQFSLTEVSAALFTSQSGVSKHIKDLEDELGIALFARKGKRLLGLTEPGKEVLKYAEKILQEAENLQSVAASFSKQDEGRLVLATTHTQARYALPEIVRKFREEFPKVHLVMHQATPSEIATLLESDQADIGIATESLRNNESFATFPFYRWYHGVIVPVGHPLTKLKTLTLKAIAQYPIVTYHEGFTGRAMIDETFAKAGLAPEIAMVALDADVIKAYVALGMGVGIVASMAFDDDQDKHLKLLDASELFKENTTVLALRKGRFLRGYVKRFVTLCVRHLSEKELQKAVADEQLRRE